jgi:hypothetical protein
VFAAPASATPASPAPPLGASHVEVVELQTLVGETQSALVTQPPFGTQFPDRPHAPEMQTTGPLVGVQGPSPLP